MKRSINDEHKDRRARRSHPMYQESGDDQALVSAVRETDSSVEAARRQVTTGDSSDPLKSSTSSSSGTGGDTEGGTSSDLGGTFPNPTNFAERVMHILENKVAPSAIWWVDNEAVALHPQAAKTTGLLATHFHANRFSTFVRTFVRWGFKKVAHYNLPEPIVVVRNSLFQRDKPHLVHHMMMDSDVQDVFDEHQKSIDRKEQSGGANSGGGNASGSRQNPTVQQPAHIGQSTAPVSEGRPQAQPQHVMNQGSESAPRQIPTQSEPAAAPTRNPAHDDQSLEALQAVLEHSQQFLNLTSADDAQVATMRTMIQLIIVMGRKHLEVKREEEQQRQQRVSENTAHALLQHLGQLVGHQQLANLVGQQQLQPQFQGNQAHAIGAFVAPPQNPQQPQGFQAAVVQNAFQMFAQQQSMAQPMAAVPLQSTVSQQLMQQSGQTLQQMQPNQNATANAIAQMLQTLMQSQQQQPQQQQQQQQQQGQQYQHHQQQEHPQSPGVNNGCSQS